MSCVVCVHTCTGGITCTVFFRVCTAHVLSHTGVRAWAPKSHRGSARVGMHDRAREVPHTYLGNAALVGCAHSQQRAHATKARKKQRTRQTD